MLASVLQTASYDCIIWTAPGARQTLTVFTGPASKYLAFGGSYCYNPRLASGQHQSMETPPLHVLLALDAQILGGEVYDNTSPTPSVTAGEDLSTSSTTGHDDDDDDDNSISPRTM